MMIVSDEFDVLCGAKEISPPVSFVFGRFLIS
jgi:hypothetical protein